MKREFKEILPALYKYGLTISAVVLLMVGLSVGLFGHLIEYQFFNFRQFTKDYYANISTELISIAITVLVIDKLALRQKNFDEYKQLKDDLIHQVRSQINADAIKAIEKLAIHDWLFDGSMEGVDLNHANWQGVKQLENAYLKNTKLRGANFRKARLYRINLVNADLRWAKLQDALIFKSNLKEAKLIGADLSGAYVFKADFRNALCIDLKLRNANIWETDFEGSNITYEQLAEANRLRGSTMPNGARYDGMLNLSGDIEDASNMGIDINNPVELAEWYVVSLEKYQLGQDWVRKKLLMSE
jgi:uncharacterized protein YjbI with pentapeptide repeats